MKGHQPAPLWKRMAPFVVVVLVLVGLVMVFDAVGTTNESGQHLEETLQNTVIPSVTSNQNRLAELRADIDLVLNKLDRLQVTTASNANPVAAQAVAVSPSIDATATAVSEIKNKFDSLLAKLSHSDAEQNDVTDLARSNSEALRKLDIRFNSLDQYLRSLDLDKAAAVKTTAPVISPPSGASTKAKTTTAAPAHAAALWDTQIWAKHEAPPGTTEQEWIDRYHNVSIVYTWVDGSVEEYRKQREHYGGKRAVGGSRDRDSGELKFSLRSLEKALPWHDGTIYLVTPGHYPRWLNLDHPRIVPINQDDLIPEDAHIELPTFNTNMIEQYIWRIPGLSENFIQVNDDYFFGQHIYPWHLFSTLNGGIRIFTEKYVIPKNGYPPTAKKGLWYRSVNTTQALLNKAYGPSGRNFLKHMPYSYRISVFKKLHEKWHNDMDRRGAHRFRHADDLLVPLLHHYYVAHEGFDCCGIEYEFASREEMDKTGVFWILNDKDDNEKKFAKLANNMPRFLTINDGFHMPTTAALLSKFLIMNWPTPSQFELPHE